MEGLAGHLIPENLFVQSAARVVADRVGSTRDANQATGMRAHVKQPIQQKGGLDDP